ncbi:MAG: sigma-70 family RNA polymerase sigma factor [Planctomycetota bacterium]|nr:sigma-70 family RNA polymerase sigma factor [Planctomycetota bacterium]
MKSKLKPNPKTAATNAVLFKSLRQLETLGDETGAIQVRKRIAEFNIGLVYWYANRYRRAVSGGRMETEDLVGAGVIGIMKAIDRFDTSLGYAFSTYARHWIRSHIDREAEKVNVVHVHHGWLPKGAAVSLDAPIGKNEGGNFTRHEVISGLSEDPEAVVSQRNEVAVIGRVCNLVGEQMGDRAAVAMSKRFVHSKTYREIASDEGVTKQCVHLREKQFVEKVRRELRKTG